MKTVEKKVKKECRDARNKSPTISRGNAVLSHCHSDPSRENYQGEISFILCFLTPNPDKYIYFKHIIQKYTL